MCVKDIGLAHFHSVKTNIKLLAQDGRKVFTLYTSSLHAKQLQLDLGFFFTYIVLKCLL